MPTQRPAHIRHSDRRSDPALSPGCGGLTAVPLGWGPSLHDLRRRLPSFVRPLPRYYGPIRLLTQVHARRAACGLAVFSVRKVSSLASTVWRSNSCAFSPFSDTWLRATAMPSSRSFYNSLIPFSVDLVASASCWKLVTNSSRTATAALLFASARSFSLASSVAVMAWWRYAMRQARRLASKAPPTGGAPDCRAQEAYSTGTSCAGYSITADLAPFS
jgi:hypothetical protein